MFHDLLTIAQRMIDKHRLSHTGTFEISREKIAQVMAYSLALPVLKRMSFICHYVGVYFFLARGIKDRILLSNAERSNIESKNRALLHCGIVFEDHL